MMVRKLREQHGWSQDQLARFAGLSLRTIQRVEAGNRASLETLKALASVFETDISRLTEEITVIDKESEDWQSEPWIVRMLMWGVDTRSRELIAIEYFAILVGITTWFLFDRPHISTPLAFLCAYALTKLTAYIEKRGYW